MDTTLKTALALQGGVLVMPAFGQDGHDDDHSDDHATGSEHADDAHATTGHGDDGHHHEGPGAIPKANEALAPAIAAIVVFLIVLFILQTKIWPVITGALSDRENKIREEIESAEAARRQAKDALDEYEKNLAEARAEAQKMLEQTKADQQKLAADLRAKADVELNDMRERAKRDIETAKRAAVNELYADAAALASTMATKILGREISVEDQDRLIEESLRELQSSSN